MKTLEQVVKDHPFPSPVGGFMTLEDMQMQDIVRAAAWRRCLLDLPVGYGKTLIATSIGLMLEPDTTVILVPPILIAQWVAWLNSIKGAGRVVDYSGSPATRQQLKLSGARWLVTSYQLFLNDLARIKKDLARMQVLTVVDECQALKGRGKLFNGVREFSAGADLILMSGTIMSKPGDGYAYVKLNSPDIYGSYHRFENVHVAERDFFKQPTKWQHLDLLQDNLNLRRVRRTKEEVHANLPKARYIPILYDLSKDHMALYRRLMEEQLLKLDDGTKIDATTAQLLYHAAQQIITNYGHFAGDDSKKSVLFDLLDEIRDEIGLGDLPEDLGPGAPRRSKLILWSIYKRTSAAVVAQSNEWLARKKNGTYSVAAYGAVDSKKSIKLFMEDPLAVELDAQPGSAGAGLNPQYFCNEMGFIETPTTTIPFVQACGRIDRKGQIFVPNIRLLIARGTVQEQLLKNLFSNDDLVQKASGTRQGLKNMIFP